MSRYRIPSARCRVAIRVSNSRFLATVAPVFSQKDAHAFVRSIREEMPDATHHVYAFRVGHGASVAEGLSDDGEPSGTAGRPAMTVLRASDIGDVALVITRYFGGTKLGTGGLVVAYTRAAQAVFAALTTEEKIERVIMTMELAYDAIEPARRIVTQHEGRVIQETFDARVRMEFDVPTERAADLSAAITSMSGGQVTPEALE